jgi:two-component system chemotaxis sensor kinase CheA
LLGSLEGMTMLALDPRGVEAPKLASLLQQLEAATEELRAGATAGTASAEAVERSSKAEFETAGIEQKGDESTLELAKEKRHVDGRAAHFPRALVVEDAPVARELLCGILRGLGLNVEEALDGRQGISMAKSNPPDVLLTDVEMPHMNGVEMLRELKAVPALARVPVIVLTTAGKENRERLEELGVSALLPKQDLTEERLRRLIEDVLPDRR